MEKVMSEERLLRYYLKFYGYEKGRTPLLVDDKLKNVGRLIMNLPPNAKVKGFKCATEDVIGKARGVLERHFDLHDIAYLSSDGFYSIMNGLVDEKTSTIDVEKLPIALEKVEKEIKMMEPFDLPIEYIDGHSLVAHIKKPLPCVPDEDFLRKFPVTFAGINMANNITLLSAPTYGHEIIHSQLDSRNGSCLNYQNRELLSIFGEKLIAFELDPSGELLKKHEEMRFRDLFERIAVLYSPEEFSRSDLVEASVYVTSTLQATHLFDKYINGDVGTQTDILYGIQNIFDGRSTVEELLEKVNVTFENSKDTALVKRHLK